MNINQSVFLYLPLPQMAKYTQRLTATTLLFTKKDLAISEWFEVE